MRELNLEALTVLYRAGVQGRAHPGDLLEGRVGDGRLQRAPRVAWQEFDRLLKLCGPAPLHQESMDFLFWMASVCDGHERAGLVGLLLDLSAVSGGVPDEVQP